MDEVNGSTCMSCTLCTIGNNDANCPSSAFHITSANHKIKKYEQQKVSLIHDYSLQRITMKRAENNVAVLQSTAQATRKYYSHKTEKQIYK